MRLQDSVTGTRGVDVHVAPIGRGRETTAVYRLPTERRGAVIVGPLRLTVTDPFGLARLSRSAERQMTLLVYPRVDRISPPPRSAGTTPEQGASQRDRVSSAGEEFVGLRPYVAGDDLRRVHWKMSARTDELVLRQEEAPWLGRTTIVLDTRAPLPHGVDFEAMVSAAASLVLSTLGRTDQVRLVGSAGFDSGSGSGSAHVQAIMEYLALVEPSEHGLGPTIDTLTRSGHGGTVVAIVAAASSGEARLLDHVGGHQGRRVTVAFTGVAGSWNGGARTLAAGDRTLVIRPGERFADGWQNLMAAGLDGPARREVVSS
jgi:uncharacterized protein (DUF58 family)